MQTPRLTPLAFPSLASAFLACLALAGCGSDQTASPQTSFSPLHYEFLPPIRLNVASIDVEDTADHPDGDLARRSPVSPSAALAQMAHDRLVAAGPSGTATFTTTQASILRNDDGGVTEQLTAHLDIAGADGSKAGYAEAHVSRSVTTPDGVGPAVLYELTRQAMQDMNVEFEYQVRHTLADWVVAGGSAPEGAVSQSPLSGSDASSPTAAAPPAPATGPTPLIPSAPATPTTAAPALDTQQMSPPPGDLVPPPGAVPPTSGFVPPAVTAPGY